MRSHYEVWASTPGRKGYRFKSEHRSLKAALEAKKKHRKAYVAKINADGEHTILEDSR